MLVSYPLNRPMQVFMERSLLIVEAQREYPEVLEAPGKGPKRVWREYN